MVDRSSIEPKVVHVRNQKQKKKQIDKKKMLGRSDARLLLTRVNASGGVVSLTSKKKKKKKKKNKVAVAC
jgi:hypothetical protein